MQGGGGEAQPTQPAVLRTDQVTQLASYQRPGPARMLVEEQRVPHPHQLLGVDQNQLQPPDLSDLVRHLPGFSNFGVQAAGSGRPRLRARGW